MQTVCLLSGLLPFGSIFIETYFVFTSFWNYKFYYVYGFMLAVFGIMCVVVACVTIVATYLLLNAEDHRWQWHAFFAGASPALYVFVYSIYYFLFRTEYVLVYDARCSASDGLGSALRTFYTDSAISLCVYLLHPSSFPPSLRLLQLNRMSGLLQTLYFFGYTVVGCWALGIITGTVGVFAASAFVRAIFSGIKSD